MLDDWLTIHTLIAFVLGGLLWPMVKALISTVRGHASAAVG